MAATIVITMIASMVILSGFTGIIRGLINKMSTPGYTHTQAGK
jgi:hypothetical protein